MKITRKELTRIIKEAIASEMDTHYEYDHSDLIPEEELNRDYPKTLGYTLNGEKQMIVVNSLDDMNDILDLLQAQNIPYSID